MLCDITIGELGIKRLVPTPNQVRHCLFELGPERWCDGTPVEPVLRIAHQPPEEVGHLDGREVLPEIAGSGFKVEPDELRQQRQHLVGLNDALSLWCPKQDKRVLMMGAVPGPAKLGKARA